METFVSILIYLKARVLSGQWNILLLRVLGKVRIELRESALECSSKEFAKWPSQPTQLPCNRGFLIPQAFGSDITHLLSQGIAGSKDLTVIHSHKIKVVSHMKTSAVSPQSDILSKQTSKETKQNKMKNNNKKKSHSNNNKKNI